MKSSFVLILILFTGSVHALEKSLSVCTLEWPPYFSEKLTDQGWGWKVAREALEPKGYTLHIKFLPWARALMEVKHGKCDALGGAFYSDERAEWAWFSAPFGEVRTVFFKRKDHLIEFKVLHDLKPYNIAVGRGFVSTPEFDDADYLNKYKVLNASQGFRMIYKDRLDLLPFGELPGKMMLRQIEATGEYPGISQKIVPMEPPLKFNDIHLAFSKKDPHALKKLTDFNSGLVKLYRNGRYKEILREYGL